MSLVGRVFSNRYAIQRELAQGGMAEVYLALDQLLNRPVALKALFPEYAREPSFVERFRREAQAAANLNHPNIVAIYDWGQEEGTYFIVMEYVEGQSLRELIRAEGPLDAHQAAEITAEIASALAFAHRSGLVHRDVKPGNVLMTPTGTVKVTDFGIARAGASDGLTQTGSVMGTATYFSPEQAQGLAVDGRSDVYSLGIVLYEMVTGVVPFTGDSPVAVAYKHVREDVVPPGRRNTDVPADLENIIMTALAKDPHHRYQTADDMRADLLRFRRGRPLAAAPVTAIVAQVPTSAVAAAGGVIADPTTVSPSVATQDRSQWSAQTYDGEHRRNTALITAIVILGLAALFGGLLWFTSRHGARKVAVQDVVGRSVDDATSILEKQGFSVNPEREPNDQVTEGDVFDQSPNGGDNAKKGSTVTLSVSAGAGTKELPDFTDQLAEDAKKTLESSGFNVTLVPESHDTIRLGRVIRTEPAAGERANVGGNVTVVFSSGPPQVKIPDVANQPRQQALDTLSKDFSVQTVLEPSDTVAVDSVTRTDPPAGTDVIKTSAVKMFVSTGRDQATVPEVRGLAVDDAKAKIASARLQASTIEQTSTEGNAGKVIDQTPPSGTKVDPKSTVVLTVGAAIPTTTTTAPAVTTTTAAGP